MAAALSKKAVILIIVLLLLAIIGGSLLGNGPRRNGPLTPAISLDLEPDLFFASNLRRQLSLDFSKAVTDTLFKTGTRLISFVKNDTSHTRHCSFFQPLLVIVLFIVFYQISRVNPDSAPTVLGYFYLA